MTQNTHKIPLCYRLLWPLLLKATAVCAQANHLQVLQHHFWSHLEYNWLYGWYEHGPTTMAPRGQVSYNTLINDGMSD